MAGDLPTITSSAYGATSTFNLLSGAAGGVIENSLYNVDQYRDPRESKLQALKRITAQQSQLTAVREMEDEKMGKRVVQVFIVDPDENVPVEHSLIYNDPIPRLTDLNDQELFFEIPIKDLLDKHNKMRTTLINKKVKDRTEKLEPARIRDLKMVVTAVVSF